FGRRLVAPAGDAAMAEAALRLGADDPAVQLLDTSLRQLSAGLARHGKTPPTVFAAHLGGEHLDLWIAPSDPEPPAPWQAVDGGQVWRLPVAAAASLDGAGALAPYPGLVSLGMNDTGRIMVDLEVAHGLISLRGPADTVRSALAALAVELVTNRWSDRMRVTLVGFGEGLDLIAPDRVVLAGTLGGAARAGTAGRGTRRSAVRVGHRFRAHRALGDEQRGRLGPALPDHGGAPNPGAGGTAARGRQDAAPDRPRPRGRGRRARRQLDLGRHGRGPSASGSARLRRRGPVAARRAVLRGGVVVPRQPRRRAAHPARGRGGARRAPAAGGARGSGGGPARPGHRQRARTGR